MKKIILILIFSFVYGCGYTSLLKNQNQQNIKISINSTEGDFQTNNFIKNQIKLSSNPLSTKNFDINILSSYEKIIIAKDSAGVATDYKINISLDFIILSKNNLKVSYSDSINIKNNSENFEQIEYEREIKKNFASDIKDKLILYLLSLDDS
tara:strand:- start:625 stop:1080 length:456 start_codon:yes stop_codon:yes gene_type:complete